MVNTTISYHDGIMTWKNFPHYWPVNILAYHDGVMTWKNFPHYLPFVRGINQWLVDFPHKGSSDVFFLVGQKFLTNSWVASDLRCHDVHVIYQDLSAKTGLFQYEDALPMYGDFQYKDKTVIRLPYHYVGSSFTGKTVLYWEGAPGI